MAETSIPWCDYTFNPWWLCTEIAPECANCYARELAHRFGHGWGKGVPRKLASEKVWNSPHGWNRKAAKEGVRFKVFLGSMMDWADAEAPEGAMERIWETIRACPNLDFLMLTKRPDRIPELLPEDWGHGYPNVWLGYTVGTQARRKHIWHFAAIPAVVHFLSMEPLLEHVTLHDIPGPLFPGCTSYDALRGRLVHHDDGDQCTPAPKVDWIIPGGESGFKARDCAEEWIEDLVDAARPAGVAVFVKQTGSRSTYRGRLAENNPEDSKGENPAGWRYPLRVREFPTPRRVTA